MTWALVLCSPAAKADAPSCVSAMRIEGAQSVELRARLEQRGLLAPASAACSRAAASIDGTEGGWRVALVLDGRQVAREVQTLDDAALALESWLAPLLEAPEPQTTLPPNSRAVAREPQQLARSEGAAPTASAPNANHARAPVLAEAALAGSAALGSDGSVWAGGELGAALVLRRALWFGATLSALWDPVFADESVTGDGIHRRLLRGSVRGGARLRLGSRATLDLGLGAGLASSLLVRKGNGPRLADDAGPAFAEALTVARYRAATNLGLLGALSVGKVFSLKSDEPPTDADDLLDAALPPTHPSWLFVVSIGVAYSGELD